jgi:hypothetical protein
MLLRPEYLSQELDRPLPTKDGGILRTIRDACDYMTGIGKQRELRSHWQPRCSALSHLHDLRANVSYFASASTAWRLRTRPRQSLRWGSSVTGDKRHSQSSPAPA